MVHAIEQPTNLEHALITAIGTGQLVELPLNKPETQDPVHGSTWGAERTVPAELLAALLTGARKPESGIVRMLKLRGARISGSLDLEAATLICPVVLQGCFFEQPVVLKEARGESLCLHGCYLPELNAQQLTTRGNLELNAWRPDQSEAAMPFWVERGVNLHLARISGQLDFGGARLANPDGPALNGNSLTVDQHMFCSKGFRADGRVDLTGAHVGQLDFGDARLANPDGPALNGNSLTVDRDMFCRKGFRADGGVDLTGAHVGQLDFGGARLANPDGPALDGNSLTVDRDMFCRKGFRADGGVDLTGAHVGGQLDFDGARLANPDGPALNGGGLTVDQHMFCSDGFRADGGVDLTGAHVGGQLDFEGARLANPDGPALNGNDLTVDQHMFCRKGFRADGRVDLKNAQVKGLLDDKPSWPRRLRLEGFTYNALEATGEVSVKERLDWLERTFPPPGRTSTRERLRSLWRNPTQYAPQPYEQLAAVYRRAGRPEDARTVLIAKQRRRRHAINPLAKVWNSLLEWTVGYGYQTWKAGIWLMVLVGLGWWIFDRAHPAHLAAAKPPGQRPWFHAGVYALDLLLPFADLGYQAAWIASGWARWFYLGWNLAGWVLITAVVAALSGLTKRD